jgi:multidrug efflux system outer membrane protein
MSAKGSWKSSLVALAVSLSLAACAGLPPKPGPTDVPTVAPLSDFGGAGGAWPTEQWWKSYHDATLDQLVDMALATSPTLATARARLHSARQSVRIAGAQSGAQVDAVADADRQRLSDSGLFPPRLLGFSAYNLYDLGLQASYDFDWWGKQKDTVESAMDEAHASQAERTAAALILASSVTDAYFAWQADQSRLELVREKEATVLRQGAIMASRIRAQLEAGDEVHRTDADLAAVREQIAGLEGAANLQVVALAGLIGRSQAELPALTMRPLPQVGGPLPDNVSIDLIARRADITASRWRIEAAERTRDSARAEFYPDISINALIGVQSVDIGSLLKYGSRVPQVAGAIHLPIFDSGRLKARYGAAQSAIESAVASYQETLVGAARDVATQAATRAQIASERAQRVAAVDAAQKLIVSAAARVRQGVIDSRAELTATESWIEQRDALLQLDAEALSTDIGLQRALGGGYERTKATP